MKRFDMEASLAGRPLETRGLAIPKQATIPARNSFALDSTLDRGNAVSIF
jgi:hypothetical protein